ncbi:LpqB family beta-propeller domain-containing protein [Actinotalea sp. C106]|uniref:LpqB family beta-propeller domain-containing protein n=1 Tax=Actinotalea sp. C106 TaxID=2908644 RepID=UPI0020295598|nr:LpqB family beta-propeller domain-containing protein [Actinotalea sp. C106]
MRQSLRQSLRRASAGVAALAVLAGCAVIPTSGPIGTGEVELVEPGSAIPLADDPEPDAEPEAIVRGFLDAGAAGLYDEFTVARKFLTGSASARWSPRSRVLVYSDEGGGIQTELRGDDSVMVTVPVEATVDASGAYVEAVPGSREELVFDLVRDAGGQWRVSRLDDGVLMLPAVFDAVYRRTPLYFATPDRSQLVPDVRWFPTRSTATYAVSELLAGPSPWLRDAVVSGAPEDAALSTAAVAVTDGVATVDLRADTRVADADRELLQSQLETTLGRVPATEVVVTVGGLAWEHASLPSVDRDVAPERGPYVLSEGRLAVVERGEVVPLEDAPALTGLDANSPAVSLDDSVRVVLDGVDRLMLLPTDASAPVELLEGEDLVPPSVDRFGWVWTGEQESTASLTAVDPAGEDVVVGAEWLEGREVRSIRVSRDGARIAVVSVGGGERGTTVDVASVVRDEDGTPRLVGERTPVGAVLTDAWEVAWVDEATVAVLGTSASAVDPTVHTVPLGGPTTTLSLVDETVGIASGRGDRALYVAVADGALYSRQNVSWVRVATDVSDPVFPG